MLILVFIFLFLFTHTALAQFKINEIHPNPESDSEWVEIYSSENSESQNLEGYSLHDNYHQIYLFADEVFNQDGLLSVDVSGLNNGEDQVILKNLANEIIDQFAYTQTEKGLSWAWIDSSESFQLTSPSRNSLNPDIEPTTTARITPTITITSDPTPTINKEAEKTIENQVLNPAPIKIDYSNYQASNIKLKTDPNPFLERETRMVFLQEREDKKLIINAIMGGSLVSSTAYYLLYVRIKKN